MCIGFLHKLSIGIFCKYDINFKSLQLLFSLPVARKSFLALFLKIPYWIPENGIVPFLRWLGVRDVIIYSAHLFKLRISTAIPALQ